MVHLVDSSVLIGLFADDDAHHEAAVAVMCEVGDLYMPYCIINETVTVLTYKYSLAHAVSFLQFLDGNRNITFMDDVLHDEIAWFLTLHTRISFTDAALLLLAKKYKVPLLTFDKQLAQLARRKV